MYMCQTCVVHVSCMFQSCLKPVLYMCLNILTLECNGEVWTLIIFPPLLLAPLVVLALPADCIECRGGG